MNLGENSRAGQEIKTGLPSFLYDKIGSFSLNHLVLFRDKFQYQILQWQIKFLKN